VDITNTYNLETSVHEITLSVITPCTVDASTPGIIKLSEAELPVGRTTGAAKLIYDAVKLAVTVEDIPINDARMGPVWGQRLSRILFRATNPPQRDTWVLAVRRG
jgi:hypothetical protein